MLHINEFKTFIYYKGKIFAYFYMLCKKERVVAMDEREDDVLEMTNEEYKVIIFDMVNKIENNEFLKFLCSFIKSAIKKWL